MATKQSMTDGIGFRDPLEWRQWLSEHHRDSDGIWMKIYKKSSEIKSVDYTEALEAALCYGWIDGQKRKGDEAFYLQNFTPRRKNSLWSKRNVDIATRLIADGLMTPAGLAEIERAKQDGRWNAAYDKPSDMTVPDDFMAALRQNTAAEKFFETLNKANKYAIAWRLQTAKTEETRKRRLDKILAMLEAGQVLH